MLPVNTGFDPGTSLNTPGPAPKGGATPACMLRAGANDGFGRPAATGPGSFHDMLRNAALAKAEAQDSSASAAGEDAVNGTDCSRAAAAAKAEVQDSSASAADEDAVNGTDCSRAAAAAKAEAQDSSASAAGEDAVSETDCSRAADGSDTQPTHCSTANDTENQPVWVLLAQILQKLTAAADTNAAALEGQGDAFASDTEAGDAAEDLAALVDLLKQCQENPAALTAESAIPLDRLRQMLEQWQAGANESQPAGLPGRLLDLLKNIQEALPSIAWDRWAAALASEDGAAEKVPLETAGLPGGGPISGFGPRHNGLPVGAGHAASEVLLDAKGIQAAAGKADAAARADELSDRGRPAADEGGPGAGRMMPAAPPAASSPVETQRSSAVSSKAQVPDGSFVLPRNFEVEDTQSEVSDDSRSPAEKATAGLALPAADNVTEEGGSPGLRFEAALRDVRSIAMPDGSPDKPVDAVAAAKGRDTAAAPVKTDVFDQIVQRAAAHVKNDQGEIRIDLKPEFLGHVRLQIVTENQQVTVRILTELPMVRDMIESNIHQLKSDLQQQGLQVERVEVAVADDPRQHPGQQAWNGAGRKGHADSDVEPAEAETSAGLRPEAAYRWGLAGQTTINMFA